MLQKLGKHKRDKKNLSSDEIKKSIFDDRNSIFENHFTWKIAPFLQK
jgi:hypothetical protein